MDTKELIQEYKDISKDFDNEIDKFLDEFQELINTGYSFPDYHFSSTHKMKIMSDRRILFWKSANTLCPVFYDIASKDVSLSIKKRILDCLPVYRKKIIEQLEEEIEIYKGNK